MTGSTASTWERVADGLVAHGVDTVFGLPGDDMTILAALDGRGIRVLLVRDQRHAVYQAIGYGRVSGRPSVCFVGKGPALTHAATGLLEARSLRHPLLLISSGVPVDKLGTGAFQELDPLETMGALTVGAIRVEGHSVSEGVDDALRLSRRGRGPVLLEVPEGLRASDDVCAPRRSPRDVRVRRNVPLPTTLRAARRPLVLVGGGCGEGETAEHLLPLVERLGAAVMVTASGRGLVDERHPAFLGVSGLYAPAGAAGILREVDVILALGTRLEETATFGWDTALRPDHRIVQVLDDESDFTHARVTERVVADVGDAVRSWGSALSERAAGDAWADTVAGVHRALIEAGERESALVPASVPRVRDVLRELDAVLPTARISVHENGLHDIWSYVFPTWIVHRDAACLVPSEQTPLGFGMAAARGVTAADPRPVVVIGGDGAFGAVGADLSGLAAVSTPLLVVVLNDGGFGWLEVNRRQAGAPFGFLGSRTVVRGLCAAYGLDHVDCEDAATLGDAVRRAWAIARGGGAVVLDVATLLDDVPPGFEQLAGDFPLVVSTAPTTEGVR